MTTAPTPPPAAGRPLAPAAFVWAVFAVMTALSVWLVNRYGGRTPYFDDFFFFHTQTRPDFPPLAEFWAPLNEHRLPLPKLVTWALTHAIGFRLKDQLRLDLALLVAGAAVLTRTAAAVRGRTRYSDAFVPVVLLTLGQPENTLWAVQVNFLLPAALTATGLALIARVGERITAGAAALVGLVTLGLALSGIQGQLLAAPLAAWLAGACVAGRRAGWRLGFGAAFALLALATIAASALTHARPDRHTEPHADGAAVRYALRVLGGGWGPVSEVIGPDEPTTVPPYLGVATAGVLAVAGWWVGRAAVRQPADRVAAAGFVAFLAGVLATCAAIGYGRAGVNLGSLPYRYVTLATPAVCWAYLAAVRFGPPRLGPLFGSGLFLAAAVVAWPNADLGVAFARGWDARQFRIDQDIKRGMPVSFLVEHHGADLFPPNPSYAGPVFETLRLKRVPPFDLIPPEPTLAERPAKWTLTVVPVPGPDGWCAVPRKDTLRAAVAVDWPVGTRAVLVRYSARQPVQVPIRSTLWWEESSDHGPIRRVVVDPITPGDGREKRIWLGRPPLGPLNLSVDGPADLRVEAIVPLVGE